mmetsp:Transcript_136671/g.237685  ORF Transcript_136671/g.237685 Transcript_136671/m.237685 type:complete len:561 (+) Transcript_136671:156-1838(+)
MVLDAALKLICKERQDSFRVDPDCRRAREDTDRWDEEVTTSFMDGASKDLLHMLRAISRPTSPTGSLKTPGATSPTGSVKVPGGGTSPKAAPVLQARPVESSVHSARSPRAHESSVHSARSPPRATVHGRGRRPSHKAHGRGGARKNHGACDEVYGDENRRIDLNVDKDQRGSGKCPDKASAQSSSRRDSPLRRSNTDKGAAPTFVKDVPLQRSNTDKGTAQAYPCARSFHSPSFHSPRGGYGSLQCPRSPRTHGPPPGAMRVTATPSSSLREGRAGGRASPQAQPDAFSGCVHNSRQSRAAPLESAMSFASSSGGDWPPRDSSVVFQPRGTLPNNWPATPQAQSRTAMGYASPVRQSSFQVTAPSNATSPSLSEFAKDAEMIRQTVVAELQKNPSFDSSVCHEISNELERESLRVEGAFWQAEVGVLESLRDYVPPPVSSPAATLRAHPARGGHRPIGNRSRSCNVFWRPPPEAVAVCENVKSPSFLLHIAGGNGRENTTESAVTEGEDELHACQPKAIRSVCGSLLSPAYTRNGNRALPAQMSFSHAPHPRRGRCHAA